MKQKLSNLLQAFLAGLMLLCVFCGLILMLCESEDMHTQIRTLFGGLCLFLIGILPGIFISAKEWIKGVENHEL